MLSELLTPAVLQSLAGGKSFNCFMSGWKSPRVNPCPVSAGDWKQQRARTFLWEIAWKLGVNPSTDGLEHADDRPSQVFTLPTEGWRPLGQDGWKPCQQRRRRRQLCGAAAPSPARLLRALETLLHPDTSYPAVTPLEIARHLSILHVCGGFLMCCLY